MTKGSARFTFVVLGLTIICMAPAPSKAQPAPTPKTSSEPAIENVIVTGQRVPATPDAIAHDVIRSMTAPSTLLNEIARWRMGICPRTDGLSSRNLNNYVTKRIRDIAFQAGAPLADEPCKSNLEILFTDQPQDALDEVRKQHPAILGYHPATTVSHAVQAWYMTGTTDIRGQTVVDHDVSGTIEYTNGEAFVADPRTGKLTAGGTVAVSGIPVDSIEGWKGRPEVTSDIMGALIIADSRQTGNLKLGPVADYVAMLALTRLKDDATCQPVSSIVNLMAPSCADTLEPETVSASDLGFLRGVYKMDPGATLQVQQNDIAGEMAAALGTKH
jgi:hypothetical protein